MGRFRFKQLAKLIINGGIMKILIFLTSIIFLTSFRIYSQSFPKNQTIEAGEYFINVDPGEGNGSPINTVFGTGKVSANLNISLQKNSFIYIRFKSSNGKWSAARGLKYIYNDLNNAQYYIKYGNGNRTQFKNMLVTNEPPNSMLFLATSDDIPSLSTDDTVFVRFQSSNYLWSQWVKTSGAIVGVTESNNNLPKEFRLYDAYPNPFNPITTIKYDISKTSHIKIQVLDILGREIATLVNENKKPGRYSIEFNANNLASGVYLYRINTGSFVSTKKIVLMK